MNLLNVASNSKFLIRKWSIVNDQSNRNYDTGNQIIYNTEVLKSSLCDYNDAYILAGGIITIAGNITVRVALKHCPPFANCNPKNYWNNNRLC